MRLKVTDAGVVIPREILPDVDEVEVRVEGHVVIITPLCNPADGAIWEMGADPVDCGIPDGSLNHDQYLYGSAREIADE
ncbi:MAG TPA: hypothetical protein VLK84_32585 [Longimicrobium sp.]|nr:hypothetical protein [Longimicrobium sp.]